MTWKHLQTFKENENFSLLPPKWKDIDVVARAGALAIQKATGTRYTVGSSTNVLYAAAGGSDDYAHGVVGIPISITMELPSGGRTGFYLVEKGRIFVG